MSVTIDGGWRRDSQLQLGTCDTSDGNIFLEKKLGISAPCEGPWGEKRGRDASLLMGTHSLQLPLCREPKGTLEGLFALSHVSEASVEIQSLNIEGKTGDTEITLFLFAPSHPHSNG
jgi:hypothetical protein